MKRISHKNKVFLSYFLALALPVALQNLVTNLLNTLDTLMIGMVNETAIAGVGLANKVFFLYQLVTFGLFSGASIFTAQYWGKRDMEGIRSIEVLQLGTALIVGLIFAVPAFIIPETIIGWFSPDAEVVKIGAQYLKAVSFCYIPAGLSVSYYFTLRSTQNATVCFYISGVSVIVNGILNYGLIFGKLGMPQLGVVGAALATVIARIIELAVVIIVIKVKYSELFFTRTCFKRIDADFAERFTKTTLPVVGNESLWALGVVLYSVVFARIGTDAVASTSIASSIESLINVFFFGVASAAGIIVGKKIGQKKEALAAKYAHSFAVWVPLISIIVTLVGILIAKPILGFYNIQESTRADAYTILVLICLFMPFKNFNLINIVGSLRNGGDTRFCLFVDLLGVWAIALPGAAISGLVFNMEIGAVYGFILIEEFVKNILIILRLRSGKWVNNLVH